MKTKMKNDFLNIVSIAVHSNVKKWCFLLTLFFLLVATGYRLIIRPKTEQINSLRIQLSALKKEFETIQKEASSLAAYRQQIKETKKYIHSMMKELLAQNEMSLILDDISKIGLANGLQINEFRPGKEIIHEADIEQPIKINVIGKYNQIASFFNTIASMRSMIVLHDFLLEVNQNDEEKLNLQATVIFHRVS